MEDWSRVGLPRLMPRGGFALALRGGASRNSGLLEAREGAGFGLELHAFDPYSPRAPLSKFAHHVMTEILSVFGI